MPMACRTSALRVAVSTRWLAAMDAAPACLRGLRDTYSFSTAMQNRITAATMAMMPSNGCMNQMTARKIGIHGKSSTALMPFPPRRLRMLCKSRNG